MERTTKIVTMDTPVCRVERITDGYTSCNVSDHQLKTITDEMGNTHSYEQCQELHPAIHKVVFVHNQSQASHMALCERHLRQLRLATHEASAHIGIRYCEMCHSNPASTMDRMLNVCVGCAAKHERDRAALAARRMREEAEGR